MRPVPSRRKSKNVPPVPPKKKSTVTSRRGRNYIPSRPVVKNCMHRPVPSSKKKNPSRAVVTNLIYRLVPSWNKKWFLLYRPVPSRKFTPTAPSRPIQATIIFIVLPSRPVLSRPVFNFFPVKHVKTVPSRPVSNITSHEKPWYFALYQRLPDYVPCLLYTSPSPRD